MRFGARESVFARTNDGLVGHCFRMMYQSMRKRGEISIPAFRDETTRTAYWDVELNSFVCQVCQESTFNSNTRQWSKSKIWSEGKTPNMLSTVDRLLEWLFRRQLIDVHYIRTRRPEVITALVCPPLLLFVPLSLKRSFLPRDARGISCRSDGD
jgi:hypothetical protein